MYRNRIWIGAGILTLALVGNIIAYIYLPEELIMQITASGDAGLTLSKPLGLIVLFGLILALSLQVMFRAKENDIRRWFMALVVIVVVNILVIVFNL